MSSEGRSPFSIRLSGTAQTLLGTLTVVVLIWLSGFLGEKDGWIGDPAGDAEAAYGIILAQMEKEGDAADPGRGEQPDFAPALVPRPTLNRNLFAADTKVQRRVEQAATNPAPRKRRVVLPELTAVLIDGKTRQAVLSGEIAGVGDTVKGFAVREIGNGWVNVERYGVAYTITMESD